MWDRGYVASTDGNISARLGSDRLLVTPSGVSKGFLAENELVVMGLDGKSSPVRGQRQQPSSEILMHLEVYRQRPDVQAAIHAHPPVAIAFSVAGASLAQCVLPEVIISLGGIPSAEYATPGTTEVPESIRQAIQSYDAIILAYHGSLTVGKTLWEAYLCLERVEQAAKVTLAAQQLGGARSLDARAAAKLEAAHRELVQRQGRDVCQGCTACPMGDGYKEGIKGR